MKKEINTKRALIALLLAALLLFAGCAAEQPPDGDGDSADPAPADSGAPAKTIKLARNIYDGVPDVPAVGAVKYTSLSQLCTFVNDVRPKSKKKATSLVKRFCSRRVGRSPEWRLQKRRARAAPAASPSAQSNASVFKFLLFLIWRSPTEDRHGNVV